jgi:acetyl esterase/lipase
MKKTIKTLGKFLGLLGGLLSLPLLIKIDSPQKSPLILFKMFANSAAGFLAPLSALGTLLGWLFKSPLAQIGGWIGLLISGDYLREISMPHTQFQQIFGPAWEAAIPAALKSRWLSKRRPFKMPDQPEPQWQRDIPFHHPTDRPAPLLCDIWEPPAGELRSGLGIIYIHGSGWHFLDKDKGTRPFFRQLAARGHVVMDIQYRLCPEVDLIGMTSDTRHAIAWLKAHAEDYGLDPDRIVLGGGSAGGHLALLAALTPNNHRLVPEPLQDADLSVCGVFSYYGPTDLSAYDAQAGRILPTPEDLEKSGGPFETLMDGLMDNLVHVEGQNIEISHQEMMRNLLGGDPADVPEMVALASPINHISPDCPPVILFQGQDDALVPAEASRAFYARLRLEGIPAIYNEYAMTEHAFDVVLLPRFSPPTLASLYDLERFLAYLAVQ